MEFCEGHTVGIDLGTTFSTIAHLDESGQPTPLLNEDEHDETPSLILLTDDHHVVVGPNRMRAAMEDPEHVVERIKRSMGDVAYKQTFDGHEITPEFISALILKKLRQDGQSRIGEIGNAVITVPYYFNDMRRKATQDAGRIAGLNVIDIINEPTAATLTYAWHCGQLGAGQGDEDAKPHMVLVYDLGGGTFDVTVVRFTPTHFHVMATDGDVQLGGVDWSDRIVDHVVETFLEEHGIDLRESKQVMHPLRNDCDMAKLELSEKDATRITVRYKGKTSRVNLTSEQFVAMTADLLQRTADTTELVLSQAEIPVEALDAIVLVGGSTLMPQVPRMLKNLIGLEPYTEISPHTSVAQGAAIHAAILEAKHRGETAELTEKLKNMLSVIKQDNVNSHGLGIVATNPKSGKPINYVMIPRNTTLPAEKSQTFKTHKENQERVSIQVVEGDAPDPMACSFLGKCRIHDLPEQLPKGSPIKVTYSFDESGRISVRATDAASGKDASIEVRRRGGLNSSQIDAFMQLADQYQVD
jgi:molecular chaperone DnaK